MDLRAKQELGAAAAQPVAGAARRVHLPYLDGVRGWAALFVVLHHTWLFVVDRPSPHAARWFRAMSVFGLGAYAVPVFIVLSGYCLMIPVAASKEPGMPLARWRFVKRRAQRILPPYYATLVLTTIGLVCFPHMQVRSQSKWDQALPAFAGYSVPSHLLMLHNVAEVWRWKIDPPLWSVGLEWQIYFVFAFVLLPVWRRLGAAASIGLAYFVGLLPVLLGYDFAGSWMLGFFALGMLAAHINFSAACGRLRHVKGWIWELIAVVALAAIVLRTALAVQTPLPQALLDSIVSVSCAAFLVASTQRRQLGQAPSFVMRLLERGPSLKLGEMSYSLYLIHYPLLAGCYFLLQLLRLSMEQLFVALATAGSVVILVVSYGFHRVFERPFMHNK